MKKASLILVIFVLILSTLACNLPFVGKAVGDADPQPSNIQVDETADVEGEVTQNSGGTAVYSDMGVEIMLPDTYRVGDVDKDLGTLVEGLKAMSAEKAGNIQELYDKNKDDIMFWGYDSDSPPNRQTSVLIMKNEAFAGMSLTLISAFANIMLSQQVDSISQEQLELGGRDVLRFLTTSENAGANSVQVIYLLNDSGKLWLIGFFTDQEQLESRLPSFDAAASSFTVVQVD